TVSCSRQWLEHDHACSLARNHSLSISIKRLADFRCDGSQLSEAGIGNTGKRIRATRQHQIRATRSQNVEGVRDRVVACRTGCRDHDVYAGESQFTRDVRGDDVARIERQKLRPNALQFLADKQVVKTFYLAWLT